MSDSDDTAARPPEAGRRARFLNEDWLATIVGLAILALALLGLIPDVVIW